MSSRLKIALALGFLLLPGCGFQPMYGEHSALAAHSPLEGNMTIEPIPGRTGQILRIALEDLFNPEGIKMAKTDYHLRIQLSQSLIPTVITSNGTIQRYDVRFDTTFNLMKVGVSKPIFTGTLRRSGSYNVAPNENFSTYEAEQDAIARVLKEMAEDYVLRLTGYFASGKPEVPGPAVKLSAREYDAFLKSPDRQCAGVLIYGPDSGMVREKSNVIAKVILGAGSDPFNRRELTGDQLKSDPACLRDELSALSLMGGRRLVVLRDAGDKIAPVIAAAFEGLTTSTYLIVEAAELSPSTGLRNLFEKEKQFAALACYRSEGRGLEDTIRAELGGAGLRIAPDALQYLAANLGNDHGVTQSELRKIVLFMGEEKEVTLEIAMELTGHNAALAMEDLCHAVAGGKAAQAHALLAQMLHEGTQPVSIIRSLMRHFQRLDMASAQMAAGASPEQAIATLRPPVFFKYVPLTRRELSELSARALNQILNLLLKSEKDLKSGLLSPSLLASQTVQQAARIAG